jgi:hypothetical protein
MPQNGIVGEITVNTRRAADGRHPPFIVTHALPAAHPAWPEGTLMAAGEESGTATANVTSDGETVIGVLNTAVEANEGAGNVMLHGSCPADVLKWFDGEITPVNGDQIKALRGIGIYV